MSAVLKLLLLRIFTIEASVHFLSRNELTVALDILKRFDIHDCVFFSDIKEISQKNELIPQAKIISSQYMISAFWNRFNFYDHFRDLVYYKKGFIVKKFSEIQSVLNLNAEIYRLSKYTWLIFDDDFTLSLIPYHCQFIQVLKISPNSYALHEIYSIEKNYFEKNFGVWDRDSGLIVDNRTFYWRRLDLNGSRIISAADSSLTLEHCFENPKEPVCKIYEMMDDFQKIMYFEHLIVVTSPNQVFSKFLKFGDMALIPMIWDLDKTIKVEQIGPLFRTVINWYIKYPHAALRADYYLQPFDTKLWLVILVFLVLGSGIVLFENLAKNKFAIYRIFTVFETLCGQTNEEADNISLKITFIMMDILGFIIVNSFGAVVTSFLSIEIPEIPFHNLDEFQKNGQYRILLEENGLLRGIMKLSNNPTYKNILEKYAVDDSTFRNNTDGFFSLYTSNNTGDRFNQICLRKNLAVDGNNNDINGFNLSCEYLKISEPVTTFWIVSVLRRMSPYTESFNINYLRYCEYGIQRKMQTDIDGTSVQNFQEEEFLPVLIEQMTHVLSIPLIGILFGILIISFEFSCYKAKKSSRF